MFFWNSIGNRNDKNVNIYPKTCLLRLSISELSKILMYEFWYYYVKPKYGKKTRLCYMDKDSLIA